MNKAQTSKTPGRQEPLSWWSAQCEWWPSQAGLAGGGWGGGLEDDRRAVV